MRSLSSILSRTDGHDALLGLLELGDDVSDLRKRLVAIGNRIADDEPLDQIARDNLVRKIGQAVIAANKLGAAYDELEGTRPALWPR
jgi:hypothetical protein